MGTGKKARNVKRYSIVAICILLIGSVFYNATAFGTDINNENTTYLKEYVGLQVEKIELQNKLDEDSTYPEYYMREKSLELDDISPNEAMEAAQNSIIETEALCWYAKENGMIVSDYEVDKLLNKIIEESKNAENYAEIQEACDSAGVTFETTVLENRLFYEKQLYVDKVYELEYSKMYPGEEISADNLEKMEAEWNEAWEKLVLNIVELYKNTEEYKNLNSALKMDKAIIKDELTTVKEIEQADILVDGFSEK